MPNLIKQVAGKRKAPERRSSLRTSDQELPERRPSLFRHKNTPDNNQC
jgi:hypothetical protein